MRTAKTHFEQIPVAVVKKIAEEGFPALEEIRNANVVLKVPAKKPEPHTRGEHSRCRNGIRIRFLFRNGRRHIASERQCQP